MEAQTPSPPSLKAKVFIVEDHPLIREGLTLLIGNESDMTVCGSAGSPQEALEAIKQANPDVAVVDLALGSESGLTLIKTLRQTRKDLAILVLSMFDEATYAERALRAGARGYVMKSEALDMVRTAIRRVLAGDVYVSEKMVSHLLKKMAKVQGDASPAPSDLLTEREFEVFRMIAAGAGPSDIAQKLNLSVRTVDAHRDHIKEKLSLKSGAELRVYAAKWLNEPH